MSEERDDMLDDAGLGERDVPRGPAWHRAHLILMTLVALGLLVWLATGFYKVGVGEAALVERLGQYVRTPDGRAMQMEPGTHFGMPWPIDQVYKVAVQQIQTVEANGFNPQPTDNLEQRKKFSDEQVPVAIISAVLDPYMITADKNVVHMALTMQYRVSDPEQFLRAVAESKGHSSAIREEMLKQLVEHQMMEVIAGLNIDEVLGMQTGRMEGGGSEEDTRALRARKDLDTALRKLFAGTMGSEFGISVEAVTVTQTRPPRQAEAAFWQVTQARGQRKSAIDRAEAEKASNIASAKAEADATIKAAEAYGQQVKDKAEGEAQQFQQVWEQYQKDPAVTKYDLYQTALAEVTRGAKRIYFVEQGQTVYLTIAPPEGVVTTEGGGGGAMVMPGGPPGGPGGGPPR